MKVGRSAEESNGAFTLIELLVVIAIIMVLAGLLFPAFGHVREVARRTRAKTEVKQLETALRAMFSDYRAWPAGIASGPVNATMISVLRGANAVANPRNVIYMDFDGSSTNAAGAYIDPWYDVQNPSRTPNNVYQIALGGPNGMMMPPSGIPIPREVGAWSRAKNGQDDTSSGGDDVKSWE